MHICAILSFLLIFVLIGSVSAADADINATEMISASDNNEILSVEQYSDVLSNDPATFSQLRDEIGTGGNIVLKHDYYTYDSGGSIKIKRDGSVIDGNGAVIDMAGSTIRAFEVSASSATIKNLTIKNVNLNMGSGGAIFFDRTATVENCNFINNSAPIHGGAIEFEYSGTVVNCNFTSNHASLGGAVYFLGGYRGRVTDCNFDSNSANKGGAIYSYGNPSITNSTFVNNNAENCSAIYFADDSGNADDNWWGSNDPNFSNLINGVSPSSYVVLNVTADAQSITQDSKTKLNYAFYRNGTGEVWVVPSRAISLSTTGGQLDDTSGYLVEGRFSTQFGSDEKGDYEITAQVDNQNVKIGVNVILKPNPVINVASKDVTYPSDVIVTVSSNAGGVYSIRISDKIKYFYLDANAPSDVPISGLGVNEEGYTIVVSFGGNDEYAPAVNDKVKVKVLRNDTPPAPKATVLGVVASVSDKDVVISITLTDVDGNKLTKVVTVKVGNEVANVNVTNGEGFLTLSDLKIGTYTADVTFAGDDVYANSSASTQFDIKEATVIADNIKRGVNSQYDYYATLVDANGKAIEGREITFTIAGKEYKATTGVDGIAKVSAGLTLVNGTDTVYNVVVTNPDTLENVTATTTIVPRLIVVSGDLSADYLENPPYVVQAIGDDGNPVGENETVNVVFAGFGYDMLTNATGHVVRTIGLAPGMYAVKASYKGYNTTATVFTVNQILKVTSDTLKKTAKSYTLKATLKSSKGKAIAGKEVKLTFKGKTYIVTTNANGIASKKINSTIIKTLKAGKTYTLQARYVNDIVKGKIKVVK